MEYTVQVDSLQLPSVPAGRGPEVVIRDPSRGVEVATVRSSTVEDVDDRVNRVARSWRTWAQTPVERRAAVLKTCADAIRQDLEAIAAVLTGEQGKPLKEAQIEVRRCADTFDYYGSEEFSFEPEARLVPGKSAFAVKQPLGVVAAIVPWNFPLTLMANKLVPALIAGNGVVVKPAPTTPLAALLVLQRLWASGLPEGVVEAVLGGGEAGSALVRHPAVKAVSFTGSTTTGRAIMELASEDVKRLTLELGGSDPLIVSDDADVKGAARAAAVGRFFNCGQACIAVKRVYVMEQVHDEFMGEILRRVDDLKVGDGRDPEVRIGPQHTATQLAGTLDMIQDATRRGATVVRGGSRPDDPRLASGHFINPTVLLDPSDDAAVVSDECFGPVMPVMRVRSLQEAFDRANASRFGLGSSIWTSSHEKAQMAIETFEAGYTWVNDISTDYDAMPFGGVKQSGFGRERGREAVDEFVALRSVVVGSALEGWSGT